MHYIKEFDKNSLLSLETLSTLDVIGTLVLMFTKEIIETHFIIIKHCDMTHVIGKIDPHEGDINQLMEKFLTIL